MKLTPLLQAASRRTRRRDGGNRFDHEDLKQQYGRDRHRASCCCYDPPNTLQQGHSSQAPVPGRSACCLLHARSRNFICAPKCCGRSSHASGGTGSSKASQSSSMQHPANGLRRKPLLSRWVNSCQKLLRRYEGYALLRSGFHKRFRSLRSDEGPRKPQHPQHYSQQQQGV